MPSRPPPETVFTAQPIEIYALRKKLQWSRAELARLIGVYHDRSRSHSNDVCRWERGLASPQPLRRDRLALLATMFRDEYAGMVARLRGPVSGA